MKIEVKKSWLSALILLALAAAAIVYLAGQFLSMREVEPIYPGPGVTEIKMLSDWYPGLEGTAGDTEVYVLEGEQEGDSMLVLGGTHPNEPSGLVAAVLLIENAQPEAGTLYVIPRTNNSAFTCTDPQEGAPMRFTIDTPNGERWFRFGSRATNPIHQWPDPEIYVHASSGQRLSGSETRNINRSYPGRTDGTFTEEMSYGVTQLIEQEGIDITVDEEDKLHISIRVDVYYGYVLPDLAANIRQAISDAVTSQVGIPVGSVDVYIDGMQFAR